MKLEEEKYVEHRKNEELLKGLKVYDFEKHLAWLRSKKKAKLVVDEDSLPEYGYCDKVAGDENEQERVVLATFGRSGNTFFRNLLEKLTGLMTGSTQNPLAHFAFEEMGLLGEGLHDRRCWVIKTHYPQQVEMKKKFLSERGIVIVRNPLDSNASQFNLKVTHSQDKLVHPEYFEQNKHFFWEFVKDQFSTWNDFYKYWLH